MRFEEGQRIAGSGRDIYVVGRMLRENDSFAVYSARKMFFNYRYDAREIYEAHDDEWVNVELRVGRVSDPNDFAILQRKLWYEMTKVLSVHGGWFPQPIDWLQYQQVENGRVAKQVPILAISATPGESLAAWRKRWPVAAPQALRAAGQLLEFVEELHEEGHVLGALGPNDFVVDDAHRFTCIASDRVVAANAATANPSELPIGFTAPELLAGAAKPNERTDLYSWAALCRFLVDHGEGEVEPMGEESSLDNSLRTLSEVSPQLLQGMASRQIRRNPDALAYGWGVALRRCLSADPAERPESVDELRKIASRSAPTFSLKRLWRGLVG